MPQWHFQKHTFGTGFALAETINKVIKKHRLRITKVIRLGPRFFIAEALKKTKPVFFKICLEVWTPVEGLKTTPKSVANEIAFLTFLQKSNNTTLAQGIPKILDTQSQHYVWILRTFTPGNLHNQGDSNFLFTSNFFTRKNILWLTKFFGSLHQEGSKTPQSLKKKINKHTLKKYEDCLNWKKTLNTNKLGNLVSPIQKTLNKKRKTFDQAPKVLTHHEPYASHFVQSANGNLTMIDWENIGFNNPIHDISIIWIRGFGHPQWQKELLTEAQKKLFPHKTFEDLLAVEILLQSIGNLSFFHGKMLTREEKKIKKKIIPYFESLLKTYSKP